VPVKEGYRETIAPFLERPGIRPGDRHLAWIASALALGGEDLLRDALGAALEGGVPAEEVREAIVQSYLFVGYPRVINGLILLREACGAVGVDFPDSRLEEDYAAWESWAERGERLCRTVYGSRFERLEERIAGLHAPLARWMIVEGYGKVLGGKVLPPRRRQLLVVSVLAAQGAWRQLRSHLLGGLHLGLSGGELRALLEQIAPFLPGDRGRRALELCTETVGGGSG
jgi:alkylhydroperoxidase/carboxymuconolactone decarboxylase family protein YurZ